MRIDLLPEMSFADASALWLENRSRSGRRAQFLTPGTIDCYDGYLRALNRFFAGFRLCDIHIGHISTYQDDRASGKLAAPVCEIPIAGSTLTCQRYAGHHGRCSPSAAERRFHEASATKINQEVSLLIAVLRRAGCWSEPMSDAYEPFLPTRHDLPRALTAVEQAHWLSVASSREAWRNVYLYSLIAFRTALSNCEMRGLRVDDVNLHASTVSIGQGHAKNRYRIRTVPLTPDAKWACEQLLERLREHCGAPQPQWHIFPMRLGRGLYRPDLAMSNSGLKKPWAEARDAAGLPGFSFHHTRHTAITRWAEAGLPIPTIMQWAGHVSQRMMLHYTQVSYAAQQQAMQAVYEGRVYAQQQSAPPKRKQAQRAAGNERWSEATAVASGDDYHSSRN